MERGRLYCVSVGPGDPELLTLKAQRILRHCPVIAAPVTGGNKTMALDIVKQVADLSGKEILLLAFPMVSDKGMLENSHIAHANQLAEKLEQGLDVAVISIGDVSVYSTLPYVSDILTKQGYDVTMIPGVTSFCACACALGQSLTTMQKPLHLFPGSFTDMDTALSSEGTKIFMKSGRLGASVQDQILASGQAAFAVSDCGLESEAVYPTLSDMPENTGYFTTFIVKEATQ